jgi:hypothetical protein
MKRRVAPKIDLSPDRLMAEAKRRAKGPFKTVSVTDKEYKKRKDAFNAAIGGAPRLMDDVGDAHREIEILTIQLLTQRELMREILLKAGVPHAASLFDDSLVTAKILGALELTNNKREKLDESRKNRRAGKERGKQLSKAAAAKWHPIALRLALEAQKVDRTLLAQGKIVNAIFEQWPEDVPCPESQLLAFVRDCQLKGKILSSKQFRTRNSMSAG